MKCPTCGYNSFDYLDSCKKCGSPLNGDPRMKSLDQTVTGSESKGAMPAGGGPPEKTLADELLEIPINERAPKDRPVPGAGREPGFGRYGRNRGVQMDLPYESRERAASSKEPDRYDDEYYSDEDGDDFFKEAPDRDDYTPKPGKGPDDFRPDPFGFDEAGNGPPDQKRGSGSARSEQDAQVFNLAGTAARTMAFFVDILIVAGLAYVSVSTGLYFAGATGPASPFGETNFALIYVVVFVLASTYFIFLHALGGKTIGKMLVGIKLINNEGDSVGVWTAFVRWIGYFISAVFLFAGFLWSLLDSEGQAWHDKIAGTYVVKD